MSSWSIFLNMEKIVMMGVERWSLWDLWNKFWQIYGPWERVFIDECQVGLTSVCGLLVAARIWHILNVLFNFKATFVLHQGKSKFTICKGMTIVRCAGVHVLGTHMWTLDVDLRDFCVFNPHLIYCIRLTLNSLLTSKCLSSEWLSLFSGRLPWPLENWDHRRNAIPSAFTCVLRVRTSILILVGQAAFLMSHFPALSLIIFSAKTEYFKTFVFSL